MLQLHAGVHVMMNARLEQFRKKASDNLALDGGDNLTYIAPTMVNLSLAQERIQILCSIKPVNTNFSS